MNEARPAPGFVQNPGHTITIEPYKGHVAVTHDGVSLADSTNAKHLVEKGHSPVIYIPFSDIAFANLEKTETGSHCPYKGDASYWRVSSAGEPGGDAMWAYENPYDEMDAIRDHAAFYPDRVTIKTA